MVCWVLYWNLWFCEWLVVSHCLALLVNELSWIDRRLQMVLIPCNCIVDYFWSMIFVGFVFSCFQWIEMHPGLMYALSNKTKFERWRRTSNVKLFSFYMHNVLSFQITSIIVSWKVFMIFIHNEIVGIKDVN